MGTKRLKDLKVKLPSKSNTEPDFDFMENYIKSLKYSSNLKNIYKLAHGVIRASKKLS